MPSAMFEKGRKSLLKGEDSNGTRLSLNNDDIRLALIDFEGLQSGSPVPYGKAVTGATNATPIVITSTGHGFSNGDIVLIVGVGGNLAANGVFKIKNVAANTFELTDPENDNNIAGTGTYTSGGRAINMSVDEFMSSIDVSCIAARTAALASKTFDVPRGGVFDCADTSVTPAANANACEGIVVYKNISGNDAISPKLALITGTSGLPIVPPWDAYQHSSSTTAQPPLS
jgi:hypothetical protein